MTFGGKAIFRAIDGRQITHLRRWLLVAAAVEALLPVALSVYIGRHANPLGDGLEWAALVPALSIVAIFAVPALLLGAINRLLTIGAAFAGAGAAVSIWFYAEIVGEFSGR